MCKPTKNIKFCTCINEPKKIIHNKKSRRFKRNFDATAQLKKNLIWTLHRLQKMATVSIDSNLPFATMEGMIRMPESEITPEITNETISKALNESDCFDFEYQPVEGDQIKIRFEIEKRRRLNPNGYLSFIYKNGIWEANTYGFESLEFVKEGKVKIVE